MSLRAFTFSLIILLCAVSLTAQQAPPREPRELLAALNRVQLDPAAIYKVDSSSHIELRRGDAKLLFEEGYLGFFSAIEGKVTGAVFSGRGHILAIPRDPVEKQQLAHFLGAPMIDQDFSSAYLRFTDDTLAELRHDLQLAHIESQTNNAFADGWQAPVLSRNPAHSFRILSESYSHTPHPYFIATLGGVSDGSFDFVYDLERDEPQLLGKAARPVALTTTTCGVLIAHPELSHRRSHSTHSATASGPRCIPIIPSVEQPQFAFALRNPANA